MEGHVVRAFHQHLIPGFDAHRVGLTPATDMLELFQAVWLMPGGRVVELKDSAIPGGMSAPGIPLDRGWRAPQLPVTAQPGDDDQVLLLRRLVQKGTCAIPRVPDVNDQLTMPGQVFFLQQPNQLLHPDLALRLLRRDSPGYQRYYPRRLAGFLLWQT